MLPFKVHLGTRFTAASSEITFFIIYANTTRTFTSGGVCVCAMTRYFRVLGKCGDLLMNLLSQLLAGGGSTILANRHEVKRGKFSHLLEVSTHLSQTTITGNNKNTFVTFDSRLFFRGMLFFVFSLYSLLS